MWVQADVDINVNIAWTWRGLCVSVIHGMLVEVMELTIICLSDINVASERRALTRLVLCAVLGRAVRRAVDSNKAPCQCTPLLNIYKNINCIDQHKIKFTYETFNTASSEHYII